MKYKVESVTSSAFSSWTTEQGANERAQSDANLGGSTVEVWCLCGTFEPKAKMVTTEIDLLIDQLNEHGKGLGSGLHFKLLHGILKQLKKDGVKTLEFPTR